jgi:uncharacterized protein (DUF2384 family)
MSGDQEPIRGPRVTGKPPARRTPRRLARSLKGPRGAAASAANECKQTKANATGALGSQEEAEQWLKRPAVGLNQERPIDLLTAPAGVRSVEDYLGRLEHDVYT